MNVERRSSRADKNSANITFLLSPIAQRKPNVKIWVMLFMDFLRGSLMGRSKPESNGHSHNMMDLVREALAELGDATPKTIQKYIHDKHGVDMKTTMISSYKSNIAKKEGIPAGNGVEGANVSVKDISTIRNLIERLGTTQVLVLVKVLSK